MTTKRSPTGLEADVLMSMAEQLLGQAREAGERLGLSSEITGLVVAHHTLALAISELAPPGLHGAAILELGISLAKKQLEETARTYWRLKDQEARRGPR